MISMHYLILKIHLVLNSLSNAKFIGAQIQASIQLKKDHDVARKVLCADPVVNCASGQNFCAVWGF